MSTVNGYRDGPSPRRKELLLSHYEPGGLREGEKTVSQGEVDLKLGRKRTDRDILIDGVDNGRGSGKKARSSWQGICNNKGGVGGKQQHKEVHLWTECKGAEGLRGNAGPRIA